jgi:excinuclease ABC subunit B
MRRAIAETERRRKLQLEYNEQHGITPKTVDKEIRRGVEEIIRAHKVAAEAVRMDEATFDRAEVLAELEREMHEAAGKLEFERAAELRDRIREMQGLGRPKAGFRSRRPSR